MKTQDLFLKMLVKSMKWHAIDYTMIVCDFSGGRYPTERNSSEQTRMDHFPYNVIAYAHLISTL